jgi:ornithine cyclodeaminase/alanine dehydrogenase-like protein (mu-crystallin family)
MFKSMDGALPRFGMHALRISSDMLSEKYVEGKRRREKLPAAPGNKYVGLLLLFSIHTLEPLAIMPEGYLQRMRVGATSAVAAKHLAKKEVHSAGLIGTGWQAGAQLMGLYEVFPHLRETKVYSITKEHRNRFAGEWSATLGAEIIPVDSPIEAVQNADVLALATNSQTPVLEGDWVKPGCHVNSVQGAELDDRIVSRADLLVIREKVEPTFWVMGEKLPYEVASQRSIHKGDTDPAKIRELGDILAKKVEGRTDEKQITLFTGSGRGGSAGQGTQFVAVGAMIYKRAREMGIGREIPTDWFLQDVKP